MHRLTLFVLALAGVLRLGTPCQAATPYGKGFATPDAAAKALVMAAKSDNVAALVRILGPQAKSILSTSDPVADRKIRRDFVARTSEKVRLVPYHGRQNAKTLLAGNDGWPMPIPIVKVNGMWYFDTAQGKQEILRRRIGSNELDAIEVCRGYVEAQHDYAENHRTSNGVPYYARKIISSPGQKDGLYWPGETEADHSPIGQIIAKAFAEGYTNKQNPYHGYYFRVLTAQGPRASGGEMNYLDDGMMTRGFALVAWPADYGSTGIMTFVVNNSGIVYQKDLGRNTALIASAYTNYDPDQTWKPVSGAMSQK